MLLNKPVVESVLMIFIPVCSMIIIDARTEEVNNTTASLVVAQLLYLEGQMITPRTSVCTSTAQAVL